MVYDEGSPYAASDKLPELLTLDSVIFLANHRATPDLVASHGDNISALVFDVFYGHAQEASVLLELPCPHGRSFLCSSASVMTTTICPVAYRDDLALPILGTSQSST
eukprot:5705265-Amphidinium_carterae.2